MANTLTNLYPDLYAAVDVISRELTGFIPAVSRSSEAERAAVGQNVRVPATTTESARDISPGPTIPDDGDTEITNRPITISRSRAVPVRFQGEEELGLRTAGTFENLRQQRFFQAMRTLVNEVEADLATLYAKASRAYFEDDGSGNIVTPFGTKDDLTGLAGLSQILDENGAPSMDRQFVGGSSAWFNLRGVQTGVLQRANEAGTDAALRQGEFGEIHGLILRNSAQVARHTAGTGSSYQTNGGEPISETTVALDTGSGTILEGDLLSFASDDETYVVASAFSGGTLDVAEPGLVEAVGDNVAATVEGAYTANMAFHQNAIQLATRLPALPEGGDAADDRIVVQDPQTGLAFDVALYRGYHQVHYEVGLVWGYEVIKPEHIAILAG